jgi:6-phosphogluconolactonase
MRTVFGSFPRFALVYLGIGEDGHTASLFPNSPELLETNHLATPTAKAYGGFQRVTLTRPVLEAAGEIVFLVRGDVKKAMVERVARGDSTIPAGSLQNSNQKILWLHD